MRSAPPELAWRLQTVELSLYERVGPMLFDRVLGREHNEGCRGADSSALFDVYHAKGATGYYRITP